VGDLGTASADRENLPHRGLRFPGSAHRRRTNPSLLIYFYTPQWANAKYDLVDVKLPDITPACTASAADQGKDHKYACDYPTDHLLKAISAKLETKNAGTFDFLKKMKWTDLDQNTVTKYKNEDGMSIAAAAQKWVDDNPTVWQAWLS
jgi:glycine betaine/proline transport system substrate-binding protein